MNIWVALLISLIFYGIAGLLDEFISENISDKVYNQKPLYDFIHKNFKRYISFENVTKILTLVMIIFVIRFTTFGDKRVVVLFFVLMAILYLFRSLTFSLTQTPPPEKDASNVCARNKYGVIKGWMFSFKSLDETCIDNMFSGHASTILVICLLVLKYSPYLLEKILIGVFTPIYLFLITSSRIHYTSDVIVSIIITTLLFIAFPKKLLFSKITST